MKDAGGSHRAQTVLISSYVRHPAQAPTLRTFSLVGPRQVPSTLPCWSPGAGFSFLKQVKGSLLQHSKGPRYKCRRNRSDFSLSWIQSPQPGRTRLWKQGSRSAGSRGQGLQSSLMVAQASECRAVWGPAPHCPLLTTAAETFGEMPGITCCC